MGGFIILFFLFMFVLLVGCALSIIYGIISFICMVIKTVKEENIESARKEILSLPSNNLFCFIAQQIILGNGKVSFKSIHDALPKPEEYLDIELSMAFQEMEKSMMIEKIVDEGKDDSDTIDIDCLTDIEYIMLIEKNDKKENEDFYTINNSNLKSVVNSLKGVCHNEFMWMTSNRSCPSITYTFNLLSNQIKLIFVKNVITELKGQKDAESVMTFLKANEIAQFGMNYYFEKSELYKNSNKYHHLKDIGNQYKGKIVDVFEIRTDDRGKFGFSQLSKDISFIMNNYVFWDSASNQEIVHRCTPNSIHILEFGNTVLYVLNKFIVVKKYSKQLLTDIKIIRYSAMEEIKVSEEMSCFTPSFGSGIIKPVRSYWQYSRKDGSQDLRFKDNRFIKEFKYTKLTIPESGITFYTDKLKGAEMLAASIKKMKYYDAIFSGIFAINQVKETSMNDTELNERVDQYSYLKSEASLAEKIRFIFTNNKDRHTLHKTLLNTLDDYHCFNSTESIPYKKILKSAEHDGLIKLFLEEKTWNIKCAEKKDRFIKSNGLDKKIAEYIVMSIAYGFMLTEKKPQLYPKI